MIIQLDQNITTAQRELLATKLSEIRYKVTPVSTQSADYVIGVGKAEFDIRCIGTLPGIRDIHGVSDDYKLVSGKWKVGAR